MEVKLDVKEARGGGGEEVFSGNFNTNTHTLSFWRHRDFKLEDIERNTQTGRDNRGVQVNFVHTTQASVCVFVTRELELIE